MLAEQRELRGPRQALDPCLLAPSGARVRHRYRCEQLHRQAAAGVAAAAPGGVGCDAALDIDSPARVEGAVATAQDIDPGRAPAWRLRP